MKRIHLLAVTFMLLCLQGITKAQSKDDHLEPVSRIYDIYDPQFEYYFEIRKILFRGLTDSPEIRFHGESSKELKEVFDIEFDIDKNKYYITYRFFRKLVWQNGKLTEHKMDKFKTEIDKTAVDLIKSLFDIAISQVRFSEKEIKKFDRADYYFSVKINDRLKTGMVWSPSEESKMSKLVDIGQKLAVLARFEKKRVTLDEKLQKEIEDLINELKNE